MSDSEEINCTPPQLRDAAESLEQGLLPEKSRTRYENVYHIFKSWCAQKGVKKAVSETVILAYFSELAKTKKPSTLWSTYSMLRTTLNIKDKVDISKFPKLLAFLKRQNQGYKSKKSSTFSFENIEAFLKNAPKEMLTIKVALIMGISGACRSDELYKMKLADVAIMENKVHVEIPTSKTYQSRAFVVNNEDWVMLIKEYVSLRLDVPNENFFLQIRFGRITRQPFGHNSISQFPKKIAVFLGLRHCETFTGHCFRRTAATLLVNGGGDILQLKRLGGWKSSAVAEGYVDKSTDSQLKIATRISGEMPNSSTKNVTISTQDVQKGVTVSVAAYNQANITINFVK
ncbi:MAG: tyrosine-type recombinase/integrase [Candidatus Acidiferrales bacterium]